MTPDEFAAICELPCEDAAAAILAHQLIPEIETFLKEQP